MSTSKWYRIENSSGLSGASDVFIYDEIGRDGVGADIFVEDLAKVKGPINLRLNSPGGEVFDGIAIHNALKTRGNVTVYIDSLAASIASVIAMAGDKVVMSKHSAIMIHDAQGGTQGNASDFEKMLNLLNRTSDEIATVYAERAGGTPEEWRARMKEETWYNVEQAIEAGLADEELTPRASRTVTSKADKPRVFNLSNFKNVPEWVLKPETVKDEGKVLSKANLEQMHTMLSAARKVHDAACDVENCSESMKARTNVTIKNYGNSTVGAVLVACMHESLTDMAQNWLSDGTITMPEFLSMSAMITALVTQANAGAGEIGIGDRECTHYGGAEATPFYAKADQKVTNTSSEEDEEEETKEEVTAEATEEVTAAAEGEVTAQASEELSGAAEEQVSNEASEEEEQQSEEITPLDAEHFMNVFAKVLEDLEEEEESN